MKEDSARQLYYLLAIGFVLAGLGLVAYGVSLERAYWFDESWSLAMALMRPDEAMYHMGLLDLHPPLYYLALSAWVGAFGYGELAVRGLSLLCALAALALLWWQGRRLLPPPALALAAIWMGTHWMLVYYSQEARMYPMSMLGSTWVALGFARLWCGAGKRLARGGGAGLPIGGPPDGEPFPPASLAQLCLFCLGALVASFVHYFTLAMAGSALLLLLWRYRRDFLAALVLVFTGTLPLAWFAVHSMFRDPTRGAVWIPDENLWVELGTLLATAAPQLEVVRDSPRSIALLILGLLAVAIRYRAPTLAWWRARTQTTEARVAASMLWLALPWCSAIFVANLAVPVVVHRYLIPLVPVGALALGALAALAFPRYRERCVLAALVGAAGIFVSLNPPHYFWMGRDRPYNPEAAHWVASNGGNLDTSAPIYRWASERDSPSNQHKITGIYLRKGLQYSGLRLVVIRSEDTRHFAPPYYLMDIHCGSVPTLCTQWVAQGARAGWPKDADLATDVVQIAFPAP